MGAKVVKAEYNAKQKTKFLLSLLRRILPSPFGKGSESRIQCKAKDKVFAFIVEAHPTFALAKVVKAEYNAKQKPKFLLCW